MAEVREVNESAELLEEYAGGTDIPTKKKELMKISNLLLIFWNFFIHLQLHKTCFLIISFVGLSLSFQIMIGIW